MPSLAEGQSQFINCLQNGPNHFPSDLFSESAERALLGLKAHANTVSHARLVALENAYPKLYEHMGHEKFHTLSRDYVEQEHILTCDMNMIAKDFAAFLSNKAAHPSEIDLARVEWAWLESYYSADATPLELTAVAGLDETDLLAFPIGIHPAVRLIKLKGELSTQLSELGGGTPFGLMIARPAAQVLFHPLDNVEYAIAEKIQNISTLGNLLDVAIELGDESSAMERIIRLVQAGGLIFKGKTK